MSTEAATPLTETRKPHTVYLTAELWSAIERSHLELRLQKPEAPSKIEYIEQVLRAGLENLSVGERQRQQRQRRPTATPPSSPPEPASATRQPTVGTTPPIAVHRRPTALERLKQASDPGQPAPIRSVADTT
jgi:hypothetical protein